MISLNYSIQAQVLNNHISVQVAAWYSGYSTQYLGRLLRSNKLEGVRIGQMWRVEKNTLDLYIAQTQLLNDRRFGQK